jgi:hypothetical protein
VAPLPFNLGLVQLLADHRNIFLTKLAHIAAFAGEVEESILLAALIYVVWNKRLAIQLSVVMLAALSINDLLKMLAHNPHPFIAQGTYLQKWAVPAKSARTSRRARDAGPWGQSCFPPWVSSLLDHLDAGSRVGLRRADELRRADGRAACVAL